MICWINKIEINLQYALRNQYHIAFAKVPYYQLCQMPFEYQLELF